MLSFSIILHVPATVYNDFPSMALMKDVIFLLFRFFVYLIYVSLHICISCISVSMKFNCSFVAWMKKYEWKIKYIEMSVLYIVNSNILHNHLQPFLLWKASLFSLFAVKRIFKYTWYRNMWKNYTLFIDIDWIMFF